MEKKGRMKYGKAQRWLVDDLLVGENTKRKKMKIAMAERERKRETREI